LQQIIGTARFGADARHLEAAERLAIDQGAVASTLPPGLKATL
jgi:hypothetical protein